MRPNNTSGMGSAELGKSSRRTVLKALGAGAVGASILAASSGTVAADGHVRDSAHGTISLQGHDPGERPELEQGIYTQGSIRDDGQLGVLGGYFGTIGTSLFDLSDPTNPEFIHRLPSSAEHRQNGVKFLESTAGIYIRTMEPNVDEPEELAQGIQVVDYGWGSATAQNPEVIGELEVPGGVHKLDTHREEPVAYLSNTQGDTPGTWVVDLSDPANPEKLAELSPPGYDHAPWVDMGRDYLYSAHIAGEFEGIVIRDISDPYDPELVTQVNYDLRPDYEEIGEPGFESCHFVAHDPERDILIVGDEVGGGIPGGKHIWDIGWDSGSPEEPEHIGFTHSPSAELQGEEEPFFWTTHMHDVIPQSHTATGRTLLVDGGYHEGTWVCDITDPTDPQPAQQHIHKEGADVRSIENVDPAVGFLDPLHVPFTWSAEYNRERGFVFASDCLGGAYTFEVTDDEFEFLSADEAFAQSDEPTDTVTTQDLRTAIHYWRSHQYYPNSGGRPMDTDALRDVISRWRIQG